MGSRSKTDLAYIAGFLDGDGSLMIQLKKRSDSKKGVRIMFTICFYQDTRHEKPLHWIKSVLGIGYLSRRNDGMSELRINGYDQVENILTDLLPFIRFKKKQAEILLDSVKLIKSNKDKKSLKKLVDNIVAIQQENYATRKKRSKSELLSLLGLTP
ncbi:MAG: site-specific DNA endonuclease [Parcubacteria group bacterium Gr01-1014_20]|nr:MAG: site-specific DNA endonuclease [Parcubacteria group bacterium Gr01-1014_20]